MNATAKPILFYDYETSGLPLFDQPSEDPRQPHIVQCAAVLASPLTREPLASFELTAYPTDWEIAPETTSIHGYTVESARRVGVPEDQILNVLLSFWQRCDKRVGHVESFDARITRIAMKRFLPNLPEYADEWKAGAAECTAKLAKPIMEGAPRAAKIKGNPKLATAYEFFTGTKLEDAHSAMVDVLGTMRVYWAIQDGLKEIGR